MNSDNAPKISVIMAVYNGGEDLHESIPNIFNQSFSDFEFIIIDDGSTDSSPEILKQYAEQDERIQIHTQHNTGLTKALNVGLSLAKGEYIARQDVDDVSYPQRLQTQLEILEQNPAIGLVGSNSDDLYPDGQTKQWGSYDEETLQNITFLKTPFPHSTVMMRAALTHKLGGYDETFKTAQDMEFWMRFAQNSTLAMIEEPLIKRRITNHSISKKRMFRQFYDALRARWRHNPKQRSRALYHSLRSLLISLVPDKALLFLKRYIAT